MNDELQLVLDAVTELVNEKFASFATEFKLLKDQFGDVKAELKAVNSAQEGKYVALEDACNAAAKQTADTLARAAEEHKTFLDKLGVVTDALDLRVDALEKSQETQIKTAVDTSLTDIQSDVHAALSGISENKKEVASALEHVNARIASVVDDVTESKEVLQKQIASVAEDVAQGYEKTIKESLMAVATKEELTQHREETITASNTMSTILSERIDGINLRVSGSFSKQETLDLVERSKEAAIESLEGVKTRQQDDVQQITAKLATVDETYKVLTAGVEKVKESLDAYKKSAAAELDTLRKESVENAEVVTSSQDYLETLDEQLAELSTFARSKIGDMQTELTALKQSTADELKAAKEHVESALKAAEEARASALSGISDELQAKATEITALVQHEIRDFDDAVTLLTQNTGDELKATKEYIESELKASEEARTSALSKISDELQGKVDEFKTLVQDQISKSENAFSALKQKIAEDAEASAEAQATVKETIAAALKTVENAKEQLQDSILEDMRGQFDGVEDWAHGDEYKRYAMVRRNGGLWQANKRTKGKPGETDAWTLLADGIASIDTDIEDGEYKTVITLASGREIKSASYQLPRVNVQGVWDENKTYAMYDAVIKDGNAFLAVVPTPGKLHEAEKDWLCVGYRGRAGKAAKDAPTAAEVASEVRPLIVRELAPEIPQMVKIVIEDMAERGELQ